MIHVESLFKCATQCMLFHPEDPHSWIKKNFRHGHLMTWFVGYSRFMLNEIKF